MESPSNPATPPESTLLPLAISVSFLGIIVALPMLQFVGEVATEHQKWPVAVNFFPVFARSLAEGLAQPGTVWQKGLAANSNACRELRVFETNVTTSAWPIRPYRDHLQANLSALLATGNEQVVIGREGWMFFRPDVDALTAPGFLQAEVVRPGMSRAQRKSNPLPAIQRFAADLRTRGIELILLPIPSKAAFELPLKVTPWPPSETPADPIHNADYQAFIQQFRQRAKLPELERNENLIRNSDQSVVIGDLDQLFQAEQEKSFRCYLKADTHWTPTGLELSVQRVAREIRDHSVLRGSDGGQQSHLRRWKLEVSQPIKNVGDTAILLGNGTDEDWGLEEVRPLRVIEQDGTDWQLDPKAEILVLGDSFSNIYSQSDLGWGTSAGFVEHLSFELNTPLDVIAINAGGALASRQELVRQLQQGQDRLAGKKLVIWEFAERELTFGDWQVLPLPEATKSDSPPVNQTPENGSDVSHDSDAVKITGQILQLGRLVNPQSMPYREALLPIHLKVVGWPSGKKASAAKNLPDEIVVYVWGLKDRRPTAAADWRTGQKVDLRVIPWSLAEAKYGRFARIELDDPDMVLLDLPTYWGEP
jgi:hypothetical protein